MTIDTHSELRRRLSKELAGEVHGDLFTRGRYATDASIYQMMPAGVVLPRSVEDIQATLSLAREFETPITARGGGTCLLYTSPSPRDKRQSRMPSSA